MIDFVFFVVYVVVWFGVDDVYCVLVVFGVMLLLCVMLCSVEFVMLLEMFVVWYCLWFDMIDMLFDVCGVLLWCGFVVFDIVVFGCFGVLYLLYVNGYMVGVVLCW